VLGNDQRLGEWKRVKRASVVTIRNTVIGRGSRKNMPRVAPAALEPNLILFIRNSLQDLFPLAYGEPIQFPASP